MRQDPASRSPAAFVCARAIRYGRSWLYVQSPVLFHNGGEVAIRRAVAPRSGDANFVMGNCDRDGQLRARVGGLRPFRTAPTGHPPTGLRAPPMPCEVGQRFPPQCADVGSTHEPPFFLELINGVLKAFTLVLYDRLAPRELQQSCTRGGAHPVRR